MATVDYSCMVQESPVGHVVAERSGKILFMNKKARTLLQSDSVPETFFECISDNYNHQFHEFIESDMSDSVEMKLNRKNKTGFWVELACGVSPDKSRLIITFSEITGRKKAAAQIDALNRCFLQFGTDAKKNIQLLVDTCAQFIAVPGCLLYNRVENGIIETVAGFNLPEDFDPIDKANGHICYDVIQERSDHLKVLENLQNTDYIRTDRNVSQYKLCTYIGKAVRAYEAYTGSLCFVSPTEEIPDKEDRYFLSLIAGAVGIEEERRIASQNLNEANSDIKALKGMLPICSSCKKIRDDNGYWKQVEEFIAKHSEAEFSHGICPDCMKRLYPESYKKMYGREFS